MSIHRWACQHAFGHKSLKLLRRDFVRVVFWWFEIDWEVARDFVEERLF